MRPSTFALSAWILLFSLAALPMQAVDHQELKSGWDYYPKNGKSHPGKVKVAMVADESINLTACHLWYARGRESLAEWREYPEIGAGTQMKVILKVKGRSGSKKIADYSQEVQSNGMAVVGWADSPLQNQMMALTYGLKTEVLDTFPFRVEAGDMLVWIVKFADAPPLEVDRDGTAPFRDSIWVSTWCESCGTIDRPCMDWWTNDD